MRGSHNDHNCGVGGGGGGGGGQAITNISHVKLLVKLISFDACHHNICVIELHLVIFVQLVLFD